MHPLTGQRQMCSDPSAGLQRIRELQVKRLDFGAVFDAIGFVVRRERGERSHQRNSGGGGGGGRTSVVIIKLLCVGRLVLALARAIAASAFFVIIEHRVQPHTLLPFGLLPLRRCLQSVDHRLRGRMRWVLHEQCTQPTPDVVAVVVRIALSPSHHNTAQTKMSGAEQW